MSVTGGDAVAVIDHDGASVSAEEVGEGDGAVGGGDDGRSDDGGNIDAGVEGAFSIKWIDTFAERAGDLAFDGPEVRSGVGADPVGGGGIFGESERDAYAGCAGEGGVLEGVELVEGRIHLRFLHLFGLGSGDHRGIGLESVECGNFAGE